jgi:hypothetical protein
MFSLIFYLICGVLFLVMGVTGRGMRKDLEASKAKMGKRIFTICGAGLLVGALWEFLDMVL